jgi:hypothetical protein
MQLPERPQRLALPLKCSCPSADVQRMENRSRGMVGLPFKAAIALWIICTLWLAVLNVDPDRFVGRPRGSAEIAGAVIAAFVFPLVVAAAIKLVYAKLRRRHFVTPGLFVIAAGVALFAGLGQVGQRKSDDRQAFTTECVDGVLAGWDQAPPADRPLTRPDTAIFGRRYCEEAFRRGFGTTIPSKSELDALGTEVLHQLTDSGEIKQLR